MGFRFILQRDFRIRVAKADAEMEIPVEWAFGSGTHGVTFVSRIAGDSYLEHAFSYYAGADSFDLSPGHRALPSRTLLEAAGQTFRLQGPAPNIRACFQCHSTGPVTVLAKGDLEINETGVRCEACHGPGQLHAAKPAKGSIRNPRSMTAGDLNRFCGSCHRSPDGGPGVNDFTNPWNVRHQPPYLEQSRCFRSSGGALSCLSCHPAHELLRRNDPDYYSGKCKSCHTGDRRPPAKVCLADASPDCTSCHMPSVAADPHLNFRNHWIGVYTGSPNLIPAR